MTSQHPALGIDFLHRENGPVAPLHAQLCAKAGEGGHQAYAYRLDVAASL